MTRPVEASTCTTSLNVCGSSCILDNIIQKISEFVSGIFNSISALFLSLFFCCTQAVAAAPAAAPNDLLLPFYRGEGPASSGATLEQILSWDDDRLEAQHDFIQWLFPTARPSQHNGNAPVLNAQLQAALRNDPVVQGNFLRACDRMLRFYGFRQMPSGVVLPAENFAARSAVWATPGNHNLLRITRILTSMNLMGYPGKARIFLFNLQSETQVDARTMGIWVNAANPR